jgi:hypothetical protein
MNINKGNRVPCPDANTPLPYGTAIVPRGEVGCVLVHGVRGLIDESEPENR